VSFKVIDNLQRYNKQGKKTSNQKNTNKLIHVRPQLFKVRNRNKGHDISCMNLVHFSPAKAYDEDKCEVH